MPRIEFNNLQEATTWIQAKIIPSDKRYEGYYTDAEELILIPQKSTRPLIQGYVYRANYQDVKKLFEKTTIDIYRCREFEWNADRGMSKNES